MKKKKPFAVYRLLGDVIEWNITPPRARTILYNKQKNRGGFPSPLRLREQLKTATKRLDWPWLAWGKYLPAGKRREAVIIVLGSEQPITKKTNVHHLLDVSNRYGDGYCLGDAYKKIRTSDVEDLFFNTRFAYAPRENSINLARKDLGTLREFSRRFMKDRSRFVFCDQRDRR